ncbi:site-specific integrase [Companilactobacillus nantensis]|nr:site-specific integrase [Companilactobacillus nantensis]GEO63021.1 hypothetical protein LNA01_02040 [Companilactobacillus nantensis]
MKKIRTSNLTKYELEIIDNYARVYGSLANTAGLEVLLALYTGMRFKEISGLTWEDIDLVNNSVRIVSKVSTKKIPVDSMVMFKLEDLKKEQRINYAKHGYVPETNYVFINKRMHRPTVVSLEKFISDSLNTNQRVLFRTLRDSVKEIDGHENIKRV